MSFNMVCNRLWPLFLIPLVLACVGNSTTRTSPPEDNGQAHRMDGGTTTDAAPDTPIIDRDTSALAADTEEATISDAPSEADTPNETAIPAPTTTQTFNEDTGIVLNPERGFYSYADLLDESNLSWIRNDHKNTIVYSYIRLDAYRNRSLDASMLEAIRTGLSHVRGAGLKAIVRFAYNFGPYPDSEPDAPRARVLEHIAQVKPILEENKDILLVLQAGFIGAWGEWHTSTENLLDDPSDRQAILDALLDAVPSSRMVQLRYPRHKEEMYGDPLNEASAWSGANAARVGHHNDCFLASDTDLGTYPEGQSERYKTYLEQDTRFVPMGGETCRPNLPRSGCATALAEMERLHFSYINRDYHEDVIATWRNEGCEATMQRRLGPRFVLQEADLPARIKPGGHFVLRVAIANQGWAAPFNPRPAVVVLDGMNQRYTLTLTQTDVRRWAPGQTTTLQTTVELPATLPEGTYKISLALPDADERLRQHSNYAVRFANAGTWDETTGANVLGTFNVDANAPGTRNEASQTLHQRN